jgi:hypothetical protein
MRVWNDETRDAANPQSVQSLLVPRTARLSWFAPLFAILLAVAGLGHAQNSAQQQGSIPTFGTTVVISAGLTGEVYPIKPGSQRLPNFKNMKAVGKIYTTMLNVRQRDFAQGFPGVLGHFEWFAIDYTGRFWIEEPGKYRFRLSSADGSKLYIDGHQVVNHDGHHPPSGAEGGATLGHGVHRMRVEYFLGPRLHITLVLEVARPGDHWTVFSTDEFRPPANSE